MSENQARLARDLYDYEHDEPRTSGGRRRRPVADWGVGEDVFDHMPRNRFSRVAEAPRERRFPSRSEPGERRAEDAESTGREGRVIEADWLTDTDEQAIAGIDPYEVGAEPADARHHDDPDDGGERPPRRRDAEGARGRDAEAARGRDAEAARRHEADVPRGRVGDGRRTIVIGRPEDVPSEIAAITADRDIEDDPPPPPPAPVAAPGERRTIRIGGRPEGSLEATRAQRRRPPRTAHERVGARPDRVAAYAVALGLLLILIAVISAL